MEDSFDDGPDPFEEEDDGLPIREPTIITFKLLRDASQEDDLSKAVVLNLHGKRIEQIQCLETCPNVRTIDLSFNFISKLNGLSALTKLRELKFYDNCIPYVGSGLAGLTALHTLDLSSNRLAQIEGLAGLRSLKVLRMSFNQLASLEGLGRATQLEVLDVSHNAIKDLAGLSSCVALRELNVSGNALVNLRGISRCQALQELHANDNGLTTLQGLRGCAGTLDILSVSGNRLSSLDSLPPDGCAKLSELYASDNAILAQGLMGLGKQTPALETLDLANNRLGSSAPAEGDTASAASRPLTGASTSSSIAPPSPSPSTSSSRLARSNSGSSRLGPGGTTRGGAAAGASSSAGRKGVGAGAGALGTKAGSSRASAGAAAASTPATPGKAGSGSSRDSASSGTPAPATAASATASVLDVLQSALSGLTELSSLRLEGNPDLPPGYAGQLLGVLTQLETVDDVERPKPVVADVWVNDESGKAEGEDEEDEAGIFLTRAQHRLMPTVEEMEAFKQRMGIKSDVPVMGRPASSAGSRPSTAHLRTSMDVLRGGSRPPSAGGSGGAGSRPRSSHSQRPPSAGMVHMMAAAAGAGAGRPGSARGAPLVRDVMMHQRPLSERTGAGSRLMTPEQYTDTVVNFNTTVESYGQQLRGALQHLRSSLKLDVSEAAAQVRTAEGVAARSLPQLPVMPQIPKEMVRDRVLGGMMKPSGTAGAPAAAAADGHAGAAPSSAAGAQAAAAAAAKGGLQRPVEMDDPDVLAALDHFKRLFPGGNDGGDGSSSSSTPASVAASQLPLAPWESRPLGAPAASGQAPAAGAAAGRGRAVNAASNDDDDDDRDEVIRGGDDDEDDVGGQQYAGSTQAASAGGTSSTGAAVLGPGALLARPSTPSSSQQQQHQQQGIPASISTTSIASAAVLAAPAAAPAAAGQQLRPKMPTTQQQQARLLRPQSPKSPSIASGAVGAKGGATPTKLGAGSTNPLQRRPSSPLLKSSQPQQQQQQGLSVAASPAKLATSTGLKARMHTQQPR